MVLLTPPQLEAGAVVPQSMDNQFVTRELFNQIQSEKLDYYEPTIRNRRSTIAREEFIRSLVYAPQVVVNRAFLFNNDLLYDFFSNKDSIDAFGQLLNRSENTAIQAIVPFLYRESELTDGVDFAVASEGGKAIRGLLDRLSSHPDCVRLHANDEVNLTKTSDFGKRFADYFETLLNFEPTVRFMLMEELIEDTDLKPQLHNNPDYRRSFQKALRHLRDTAREYSEERAAREDAREFDPDLPSLPSLPREYLYRNLLMDSGAGKDAVARGSFGSDLPREVARYAFEIKKLIDLRYNTNLPDLLDRYSFSPVGFPTRSALHDQHMAGKQDELDDIGQVLEDVRALTERRLRNDFLERYQRIQYSPFLSELDLSDVVAIRSSADWRRFTELQTQILNDPLANLTGGLDELHHAFADLQAKISAQYGSKATISSRYEVFVTAAVSVGGTMAVYGLDDFGWVDDVLLSTASTFLPDRLKGVAVKLVYNVVDQTKGKISRRRSWKFEVARSEEVVSRATAQSFFQAVHQTGGRATKRVNGLAEQEHS